MKTKKITIMGLSIALAMILSYVESQIPAFYAIPGLKIGLANIVVVFALYKLGTKEALIISLIRVILLAFLFGSTVSFLYSVAGACCALASMIILKKTALFSEVAISVTGGVMHNVGQITMACFLVSTDLLLYYLPILLVSGVASGIVIGLLAATLVKRININF